MYKHFFKRLLDMLLSLLATPFVLLALAIFAPIIYFTDKGPIFYNGERLGYRCKTFKMFKLRSMYVNAPDIRNEDGSTFNSEDDPRVTKIGRFMRKTSIDELPQILNVLIGDMSFVGPRPGLPENMESFSADEQKRRSVRPGITGYSQAYFRNSDTMEERMANDVRYSENVSLALDVNILFKTFSTVLFRQNINRNTSEEATTESPVEQLK